MITKNSIIINQKEREVNSMPYIYVSQKPKNSQYDICSPKEHLPSNQELMRIQEQAMIQRVQAYSFEEERKKELHRKAGLTEKYRKYITNLKMVKSSKKCMICLQNFVKDEVIKKFPCKDIFHRECGKGWMKVNNRCPVCRFDLQKHFNNLQNEGKLQNSNSTKNAQKIQNN